MLSRFTRTLIRSAKPINMARNFAASKHEKSHDDHHDHKGEKDHHGEHHGEHHDEHHDHHDHHDHHEHHRPEHQGWNEIRPLIPSKTGRKSYIDASVQPDIPHGDPADPGYDPTERREGNIFGTKLNPQRHIYMHHNAQTQFDDHYFVGDFPTPEILAEKEPSLVYKQQAAAIVFEYLSKNNVSFKPASDEWSEVMATSWQVHGIENINEIKFEIMDALADRIIVKENKFRPRIEQRQRKAFAREHMGPVCYNGRSLGEFFEHYNTLIWLLKEQSNWYRAPEIPGDYSPLEVEALDSQIGQGVKDFQEDEPHNRNFINRILGALHR